MKAYGGADVPAALPPGKEPPVPIEQEAGWTQQPVWTTWRRENSWPYRDSNSDPSVVQPVASRYTDYTVEVHSSKDGCSLLLIHQCSCSEYQADYSTNPKLSYISFVLVIVIKMIDSQQNTHAYNPFISAAFSISDVVIS
jgi:hypothetical protein